MPARSYGTAVDAPDVVRVFARAPRVVAEQTQVDVFGRTDAVLDAARMGGLAVLACSPWPWVCWVGGTS
ncbi:MAG: hypothetical protein ACRDV1_12810 [Actinomycetes bacterium]